MSRSCKFPAETAIALPSRGDLLGAAAMGVRNVLCLTGDDVTVGDQPQAKRVFDFDSIHLLRTARIMRDQGMFLSGRKLTVPPPLFLGAASNPFVPPYEWRPSRLAKKIEAGGRLHPVTILFRHTSIPAVHEAGSATWNCTRRSFFWSASGRFVPNRRPSSCAQRCPASSFLTKIVDRLRKAPSHLKREEGKKICVEIIQQVLEIEGVAGVHVMAYRQEELVAEIIREAGLLPRPMQPGTSKQRERNRPRRRRRASGE